MVPLSPEAIWAGLDTGFVGHNLVYLPRIGSTNDHARQLAQQGAPEGTLVVTDYQQTGRGRLRRRWQAPPGSSLLLSLLFRPPLAAHQLQRLTMICSLAVADVVEMQASLAVGLKWPNDVVLDTDGGPAKVAGILTEVGFLGERVDYAIVGIGLNVNLDPDQLPADLLMPATSLSQVLGRDVARLPLLQALLQEVEDRYLSLQAGHVPLEEWRRRLVTLGQAVTITAGDVTLVGVAEGVTADGALLVRTAEGHLETVLAADVTLRPPSRAARV